APWSRGKQPRASTKAPKRTLSGKGCGVAETTRRLA
ncbi:LOW QUALITY PROTEIN: retrotransposon protein, partial [Streptomyces albidoflavus]